MAGETALSRNCKLFLEKLEEVTSRCGRKPSDITVMAVAKTRTLDEIREAVAAGLHEVGENRVQEAERKYGNISRDFRIHMIGHLQSNKAKAAVELFDVIQSVDTLRLAEALELEYAKRNKVGQIMLEVNTSGELQKYGFEPGQTLASADRIFGQKHLVLTGLMTVGPLTDDEGMIRESFRTLRELFEKIGESHPDRSMFKALSMGMSDDYEIAIEEGSTMIRIGRALFGARMN